MVTEKGIKQSVLIVGRNVKFHLNPTTLGQYTAESATQKEDRLEDFKSV